jgi:hypothetical protein
MLTLALVTVSALSVSSNGAGPLPLSFTPNRGQHDASVEWAARGREYGLFLDRAGVTVALHGARKQCAPEARLRLSLVGASARPLVGDGELPGVVNSYVGPVERWREALPTFARVMQAEAWPGVDAIYYGSEGRLEIDLVVKPGADLSRVVLAVDGGRVRVTRDGALRVTLPGGDLTLPAPVVYQMIDGARRRVDGRYRLRRDGRVGFTLGTHDARRAVVIDPVLVYSTYFGGSGDDLIEAAVADGAGAFYVTGNTTSTDLPRANAAFDTENGGLDAFVVKVTPSGQALVFATYLGGSSDDSGQGIAVDPNGNVYVAGQTTSTNFPNKLAFQGSSGGQSDAFVTMLTPSGSLGYSSYLGGSGNDFAFSIGVDATGAAYVVGSTDGAFPSAGTPSGTGGDAFLAKVGARPNASTAPSLAFARLIGGSDEETAYGVAVHGTDAWVTGSTLSTDFLTCVSPCPTPTPQPTPIPNGNVFVTRVNSANQLVYSRVVGGGADDTGSAIAVDAMGAAYAVGLTDSNDFPTVNALQSSFAGGATPGDSDAFAFKLSPDGSTLLYSTFLGGNGDDEGFATALDPTGALYIGGITTSSNFPVSSTAEQKMLSSVGYTGFLARINASGTALAWSTLLGGTDGASNVSAVSSDGSGGVYTAGFTLATDLVTKNPLQNRLGMNDCFLAKLDETAEPPTIAFFSPPSAPADSNTAVTINGANFVDGATVTFDAVSAGGVMVLSPDVMTATTPLHAAGKATVVVTNPDGQSASASFTFDAPGAPTLSGLAPASGPESGGTIVTITGSKIVSGATVTFGGIAATGVSVLDSGHVTATTPAHAAGAVDVVVANGSDATTLTSAFTYTATSSDAPSVSSVTPSSGPTGGGTQVAILGNHFLAGATVSVGGNPATNVQVVTDTTLLATTPAGTAGAADVTVTNTDMQSGTLKGGFTYGSASSTLAVVAVVPDHGGTRGGDSVRIIGANFMSGVSVNFGGAASAVVTVTDGNDLTAETPAHAAGKVDVVLTGADGQTATLTSGFTYQSSGGGCGCGVGGGATEALGGWLALIVLLLLARYVWSSSTSSVFQYDASTRPRKGSHSR